MYFYLQTKIIKLWDENFSFGFCGGNDHGFG